ncbi:MAG: adenosylmethionine-8-amino-7-oxononanoate aminotransferase [Mariniblastus sp.]|nr:adenosylmethionine-8-amino-7-oxononanoate aminotransferase [Mariniblastus sp.]
MPHCVEGRISEIGPSGSLVTDILQEQLAGAPHDENISIEFSGHQTFGLFDLDHDQPESTMVAKIGEKGTVEIEIVGLSLSEMLGIGAGETVKVCW